MGSHSGAFAFGVEACGSSGGPRPMGTCPAGGCACPEFPVIFPEMGTGMANKAKSSVAMHRARKVRQGFVRVEVNVRKEDASLVRRVASALSDPSRQVE